MNEVKHTINVLAHNDRGKIIDRIELSLEELATSFASPEPGKKDDVALVVGAKFGDRRTNKDCEYRTLVPIDIDNGPPWEELRARIKNRAVLHTTASHTKENPRYRIFIELSRPVPPEEWPRVWAWVQLTYPEVDYSGKDIARVSYAPVLTDDYRCVLLDGPPLDVDALPKIENYEPQKPNGQGQPTLQIPDPDLPATQALLQDLLSVWPPDGQRDMAYLATAGYLAKSGFSENWTIKLLAGITEATGSIRTGHRAGQVKRTFELLRNEQPVIGFSYLQEHAKGVLDVLERFTLPYAQAAIDGVGRAENDTTDQTSQTAQCGTAGPNPTKVLVEWGGDVAAAVDFAANLLKDLPLFQRNGRLVVVSRVPAPGRQTGDILNAQVITPAWLRYEISARSCWVTGSLKRRRQIPPPQEVISALLDMPNKPVPKLMGLLEHPAIRGDGTVIVNPGYDAQSGFFMGDCPAVDIPEHVTEEDAIQAYEHLSDLFVDFPFSHPSLISVPIAAMLTAIARPALVGCNIPAFIFDASTPGSGKTLITDVISEAVYARQIPKFTYPKQREELEKILSSIALSAYPCFAFDNVDCDFGGGPLDKVLTGNGVAALRVLGKSETPNVEWASMVLVTANNFEISGDTVRRIILCRLEPKIERPETRTQFKYNDLLFYVKTHRPRILRHLLTILLAPRGQVEIGRMGSFEKWVELIGGAIFSVSGIDITKLPTQTEILNRDVRRSRLAVLLALIEALQIRDNRALPQEFTSQELIDSCSVSAPPEWRELFSPNEVSVRSIGRLLSSVCGRVLDGKRLVRRTARGKTVWAVERVSL